MRVYSSRKSPPVNEDSGANMLRRAGSVSVDYMYIYVHEWHSRHTCLTGRREYANYYRTRATVETYVRQTTSQ